jgi:hypothetical protein
MSIYKLKPVEDEAIQFNGNNYGEILDFCGDQVYCRMSESTMGMTIFLKQRKGDTRIYANDFIVKFIDGEFYLCKPDMFDKTHTYLKERK